MTKSDQSSAQAAAPKPAGASDSNWFDKMGDVIEWKVVTPDLDSPFQMPLTERVLQDLSTNEKARRKACDLRCLCDGYEVMLIKNLNSPQFSTSHPCISSMPKNAVLAQLKLAHVEAAIASELEKLRVGALQELDRRAKEAERNPLRKRKSAKKEEKKPQEKSATSFRIIRM